MKTVRGIILIKLILDSVDRKMTIRNTVCAASDRSAEAWFVDFVGSDIIISVNNIIKIAVPVRHPDICDNRSEINKRYLHSVLIRQRITRYLTSILCGSKFFLLHHFPSIP